MAVEKLHGIPLAAVTWNRALLCKKTDSGLFTAASRYRLVRPRGAKPRRGVHTHNGASDEAEMVDGGGGAFRAFAGRVRQFGLEQEPFVGQ
jgi:hypothetical protein